MDHGIGWGDLVLLISVGPIFSPLDFVLFICGSSMFALCAHFILRKYKFYGGNFVPLAGLQSIFILFKLLYEI